MATDNDTRDSDGVRRPAIPPHPFIGRHRAELNDTALVIDALLAPVEEYLNNLCGGARDEDFDNSLKHGCCWNVEAARQVARYVAEAVDMMLIAKHHAERTLSFDEAKQMYLNASPEERKRLMAIADLLCELEPATEAEGCSDA